MPSKLSTFEALRITQPSGRHVFSFATTAADLLEIADIPRIRRGEDKALEGYQRPEVVAHIAEIRRYLESSDAILPNTIVVAFSDVVEFEAHSRGHGPGRYGRLSVPRPRDGQPKPGFVVDGQQRLAAASSCQHTDFPLFVTAFIAPDAAEQRKQFVLVNRTKPLPQGMIFELLAEIKGHLPQQLAKQRLAAALTSRLNFAPGVLQGKIKTPTCPGGVIKDNSMRRAISSSLSDGALFQLAKSEPRRGKESGWKDEAELHDAMQQMVATYWEGVALAFPEAWRLPPKQSRLTHGVGVVALGYVMDHLYARRLKGDDWNIESIAGELKALEPCCAWTSGSWKLAPGDERGWNVLQNTDRDVRLLTGYLCRLVEEKS